ncbi:MAG TPA: CBS domain-containing protein [Burkholderiales bacterium]
MWRKSRDRPDDPRTPERETQRLARDEYDRPRYGSAQNGFGERPLDPVSTNDARHGETHREKEPLRGIGTSNYIDQPRQVQGGQAPDTPQRLQPERAHESEIRVDELMTRRVTSVHPTTSVERAVRLMDEADFGSLPVVGNNGMLMGMVTDRDIAIRIIGRGRDARAAIVADCMTERVFACYPNESVAECMREMASRQVRRIPIVDDHGRLVGIVAQADLARHAARYAAQKERQALTEVVGAVSEPSHTPQA